jgi:hypothetical protein
VVKKDILLEIVILGTRIIKRITKDTNLEAEAITTPPEIIDPMTDPDPETEANPGIEIITALDITDPEAEVNHVIDIEIVGTIAPQIDPGPETAPLHPILVMFILLTLPMITHMKNLKPS